MTPAGQLIRRNRDRLDRDERLLLVAPPADGLAAQLAQEGFNPEALCLSHATHVRMQAAGLETTFGLASSASPSYPAIVLFQPREKALLDLLLECCATLLDRDGELWLVGENRAGIKSAGKRLEACFGWSAKMDSARHCVLFAAREPKKKRQFCLADHFNSWPLEVAERTLTVFSLPGVFAHGRLDAGTRLLLDALTGSDRKTEVSGRVLDFACGSGAVALAIAAAFPGVELTLLDDSALALESARRTISSNGLAARVVASNGLTALQQEDAAAFDWVVSNPPFHAGVRQETATARRFLADCPGVLRAGGRLCLVANTHLPYGRWLPELFGDVQVLAADRDYNVWLATRPAGPQTRSS